MSSSLVPGGLFVEEVTLPATDLYGAGGTGVKKRVRNEHRGAVQLAAILQEWTWITLLYWMSIFVVGDQREGMGAG